MPPTILIFNKHIFLSASALQSWFAMFASKPQLGDGGWKTFLYLKTTVIMVPNYNYKQHYWVFTCNLNKTATLSTPESVIMRKTFREFPLGKVSNCRQMYSSPFHQYSHWHILCFSLLYNFFLPKVISHVNIYCSEACQHGHIVLHNWIPKHITLYYRQFKPLLTQIGFIQW